MPATIEHIACVRKPEHGTASVRWLPPKEREMITKWKGDVFEINCPTCGKYECREPDLIAALAFGTNL